MATGSVLRFNGNNFTTTTATYPDTAGVTGKTLESDGTNWISSPGQSMTALGGNNIDFNTTGTSAFFTSGNKPFVLCFLSLYAVDISGAIGFVTYNIGWTGPNYDDCTAGQSSNLDTNGQTTIVDPNLLGPPMIIPANTSVIVNVTSASGGTTNTQKLFAIGFYLP